MKFIFKAFKKILKFFVYLFLLLMLIPIAGSVYMFSGWFDCSQIETKIDTEHLQSSVVLPTKEIEAKKGTIENYARPEVSTFLTFPEWWIVYSSQEYAEHLKDKPPSKFPYFSSIGQFWKSYCYVHALSKPYEFNLENHIMLMVIGTSLTAEYIVKGIYENTIGWLTETKEQVPEDKYAFKVADAYGKLIPVRPWYEFSFLNSLKGLWKETPMWGAHPIRSWERKIILSMEYGFKAFYAWAIEQSTHAAFGVADVETKVLAKIKPQDLNRYLEKNQTVKVLHKFDPEWYILSVPRYQPFTDNLLPLLKYNVELIEVAGNKIIMLSAVVDKEFKVQLMPAKIAFVLPILTDPIKKRIAVVMPVNQFAYVAQKILEAKGNIEHIYDY